MRMKIACIWPYDQVRYGFLWRKKKWVPVAGLTIGKIYDGVSLRHTYGAFNQIEFHYFIIRDDRGIVQIHKAERFMSAE